MKEFIRYQIDSGIPLSKMQAKARREYGLCCFRLENKDRLFNVLLPQVIEEGEEVEIVEFEGEVWGLCPEGYKAFPKKILRRYSFRGGDWDEDKKEKRY